MFMQNAKAFRAAEKSAFAPSGFDVVSGCRGSGMLAASLVETPQDWRHAGSLMRGSLVQTWDGGLCAVTQVARQYFWPGAGAEVVFVPGGALENCSDLWLMPDQLVVIASAVAEQVLQAAAALVPARALAGIHGIRLCLLPRPVEMISLGFDSDEAVYVNSGALIHCAGTMAAAADTSYFPRLDQARARALLDLIAAGALTSDGLSQRAA